MADNDQSESTTISATTGSNTSVAPTPAAIESVVEQRRQQTLAKLKKGSQSWLDKAAQKWWFAVIGLVLGLVSFGFGIAMALRAERMQQARIAAEKAFQERSSDFTRIATDFVGAIDEQEARVRDNIERLDRLQAYWVQALEDNQAVSRATYDGVRQLQQHLGMPTVLPPLQPSSPASSTTTTAAHRTTTTPANRSVPGAADRRRTNIGGAQSGARQANPVEQIYAKRASAFNFS